MPDEKPPEEKRHTINIPHRLWLAYGQSPQKMRDTLWQVALDGGLQLQLEPAPLVEPYEFKKLMAAKFDSRCDVCGKAVGKGDPIWYAIPTEGPRQVIHQACWSDEA